MKKQKKLGGKEIKLSQKYLKSILDYNKKTGELYWIKSFGTRALAGTRAGTLHPTGYRLIGIAGEQYLEHRLAFLYVEGKASPYHIDHKNGITDCNRWKNIRECTRSENGRSTGLRIDNTSGVKGVYWSKARGVWKAQASVEGRVVGLGSFTNLERAKKAYTDFVKKTHGDFHLRTF